MPSLSALIIASIVLPKLEADPTPAAVIKESSGNLMPPVAIWRVAVGDVVPMPTLLLRASMEKVVESKLRAAATLASVTLVACVERSMVETSISKIVAVRSISPAEVKARLPEVIVEMVRAAPVTDTLLA